MQVQFGGRIAIRPTVANVTDTMEDYQDGMALAVAREWKGDKPVLLKSGNDVVVLTNDGSPDSDAYQLAASKLPESKLAVLDQIYVNASEPEVVAFTQRILDELA